MTYRVLHVFGSMDIGGAELRTIDVHRRIVEHGVEFDYLTLSGKAGRLRQDIEDIGGRVLPMALDSAFVPRFVRLLRSGRYDAVHSHVATFSGAILALARIAGIRQRIAHFRSDGDQHGSTIRRRAQRAAMRFLIRCHATDIVGVSPGALKHGYRADWQQDERVRLIVNGIDLDNVSRGRDFDVRQRLGLKPDTPIVMHVGRPSPEKNRPRVVAVFDSLLDLLPNAHLVLVGGAGGDADQMSRAIEASQRPDRVHEVGRQRNVMALMGQAETVLNTSLREGLPGVILEALAVGTPVVASDVPGAVFIGEHVQGVRTIALEEADTVWASETASAVRAGSDSDRREETRRAFERSDFTLMATVENFLELYRQHTRRGGER